MFVNFFQLYPIHSKIALLARREGLASEKRGPMLTNKIFEYRIDILERSQAQANCLYAQVWSNMRDI